MQNTQTPRRWRRLWAGFVLAYLAGVGLVSGVCIARGIYHSGQGLVIAIVAGIFLGGMCVGAAYLFFLAVLRIIWLIRYLTR
jgi:hypothetical protein